MGWINLPPALRMQASAVQSLYIPLVLSLSVSITGSLYHILYVCVLCALSLCSIHLLSFGVHVILILSL